MHVFMGGGGGAIGGTGIYLLHFSKFSLLLLAVPRLPKVAKYWSESNKQTSNQTDSLVFVVIVAYLVKFSGASS